ncbi:MAG TPA: helix-turn-helix domain-containing protein, partial [Candidatus Dormibacteraeota bacterium]
MAVAAPAGAQQRRAARVDRRRQRVADAALHLFAVQGYNVTSVDDIAARSKTSKSAFYEFFKSKEDCFRELLLQEGGALIHDVLAEAASGHDHHERLRRGITKFVQSSFERSSVARLLIV